MKVYFNNSCKICKAEIDLYKKEKCSEIDWVDITNNKVASEETNKSDKDLLRRLHVKEGDKILFGKWSGTEVKLDGQDLLIMKESDIMGILE